MRVGLKYAGIPVSRENVNIWAPDSGEKHDYQSTDKPNNVTVIHDFHSVEKAKAFAASPDLKTTMGKLGVVGEPHIWYTTKAKSTK